MKTMLNRNRFGKLAIHGGVPVRSSPMRLGRNYELIGEEEKLEVLRVLDSKSLFRYYGPELQNQCKELENVVSDLLKVRYSLAVSSGTAALRCAVNAIGLKKGDEVLVPSYTFVATVNAVVLNGAVPVFLPIDYSLNPDPHKIEALITDKTKAIIVAHLENLALDVHLVSKIARKHNLFLIEDACQAFGVKCQEKMVGTVGHIGCYSSQQEKNVSSGEGGIVVTNNANLFERLVLYHDQGGTVFTQKGVRNASFTDQHMVGENYRMSEITAAVLAVQVGRVGQLLQNQQSNHERIKQYLLENCPGILLRQQAPGCEDGGSALVMFTENAAWSERVVNALQWEGIPARRFYEGRPVYTYKSIEYWTRNHIDESRLREMKRKLQTSLSIGESAVIVPIGAGYDENDCHDICMSVVKVASAYQGRV